MVGVARGLQSKIYKILRISQDVQMAVKAASREKIKRTLEITCDELRHNPAKLEMYLNDPDVFFLP